MLACLARWLRGMICVIGLTSDISRAIHPFSVYLQSILCHPSIPLHSTSTNQPTNQPILLSKNPTPYRRSRRIPPRRPHRPRSRNLVLLPRHQHLQALHAHRDQILPIIDIHLLVFLVGCCLLAYVSSGRSGISGGVGFGGHFCVE